MNFDDDFEDAREEYGRHQDLLREPEDPDSDVTALPTTSGPAPQDVDEFEQIEKFIGQIRQTDLPKIDGKVFGTAMDLVYRSGLQQNEIPQLTIDDLISNGLGRIDKIRISGPKGETYIEIDDEVRKILEELLKHLDSHYKKTPESKLFPGYNNIKKVNRDFKAYKHQFQLSIKDFHEIRIAGIKKHYNSLRGEGLSDKDSLEATGKQFRMSRAAVSDSIHGKIKITGKKLTTGTALERETLLEYDNNIVTAKSIDEIKEEYAKFSEFLAKSSFSIEDKVILDELFKETASIFEKEFGEHPITQPDNTMSQKAQAEIFRADMPVDEVRRQEESDRSKKFREMFQKYYFGDEEEPKKE